MSGESYSDVCIELFSTFLVRCGISFSGVIGVVGGIWGIVVFILSWYCALCVWFVCSGIIGWGTVSRCRVALSLVLYHLTSLCCLSQSAVRILWADEVRIYACRLLCISSLRMHVT